MCFDVINKNRIYTPTLDIKLFVRMTLNLKDISQLQMYYTSYIVHVPKIIKQTDKHTDRQSNMERTIPDNKFSPPQKVINHAHMDVNLPRLTLKYL